MFNYLFINNTLITLGYRFTTILLLLVLMPTAIFAKGASKDWNDVKQLSQGLPIIVKLRTNDKIEGTLKEVTDDSITMILPNTREISLIKGDIKEVHKVVGKRTPGKYTLIGGAIGVGIGLASVTPGVIESQDDREDGLALIGGGLVGGLVGVGIGGLIDIYHSMQPKTKKIYKVK